MANRNLLEDLVVEFIDLAREDWKDYEVFSRQTLDENSTFIYSLRENVRENLHNIYGVSDDELDELYEQFKLKYIERYNEALNTERIDAKKMLEENVVRAINQLQEIVVDELIGQQFDEEELESAVETVCNKFQVLEDKIFDYQTNVPEDLMGVTEVYAAYRSLCDSFVRYFSEQEFGVIYEFFHDGSTFFEHIIAMSLQKSDAVPLWCATWDDETEKKETLFVQLSKRCLSNLVQQFGEEAYSFEFYESRVAPLVASYFIDPDPTLKHLGKDKVANLQQLNSWVDYYFDRETWSFRGIAGFCQFLHHLLKLFPENIFVQNPMQKLFESY